MSDKYRLKTWKELPIGGMILEGGNSHDYETGSWRTFRPVLDREKCTDCLICWIYCPDSSILVEEGKHKGFDLEHCKGCGICAEVCPPKIRAIEMVEEAKFHKE
jgi:2-oxoacid:acceptor oxidoreductase delta subunit (pyruvate/2-ketoisovalerate family)